MNNLIVAERDGCPVFESGTTIQQIAEAIGGATFEQANECLADLFCGLKSRKRSPEESARALRIYNKAVNGYPEFAIRKAVDRFIAYEVDRAKEEIRFVPEPGELATEIRSILLKNVRWKDRTEHQQAYLSDLTRSNVSEKLITPEQMQELRGHFGAALSGEAQRQTNTPQKGN